MRESLERLRKEFEEATFDVARSVEQGTTAEPSRHDMAPTGSKGNQKTSDGIGLMLDWMNLRDRYFANLFCDPVWNIMLELYQAKAEGRTVSVKRACIAANVPATTALRRLSDLEVAGLVEKRMDALDRRRLLVKLTPSAYERMGECLTSLLDGTTPATRQ